MDAGFAASMVRYGMPVVGVQYLRHRGWVFGRLAPLTDPDEIAERVAIRLALVATAPRAEAAEQWLGERLPAWRQRRRSLRDGAESATDDELADRLAARPAT